ncbi:hypothetical protein [Luteibacter rhizovicinus]|nr:hypothetical protein [Luteibacter rhizovicinus]
MTRTILVLFALLFASACLHTAYAASTHSAMTEHAVSHVFTGADDAAGGDDILADMPSLEDNGGIDDTLVVPPSTSLAVARLVASRPVADVRSLTSHEPPQDLRPPIV